MDAQEEKIKLYWRLVLFSRSKIAKSINMQIDLQQVDDFVQSSVQTWRVLSERVYTHDWQDFAAAAVSSHHSKHVWGEKENTSSEVK